MSRFIYLFFTQGYPIILVPFIESTILFLLNCLCSSVKVQLTIFVWVSSGLLCSTVQCILLPRPWYFDYCSLTVSLEIEQCQSSNVVFILLQYCVGCSRSFAFPYRISFLIFIKQLAGILVGIALYLQIKLGRIDIVIINIESSNP